MSTFNETFGNLAEYLEKNGIKTMEQVMMMPNDYYTRTLNLPSMDVIKMKQLAAAQLLTFGISNAYEKFNEEKILGKVPTACKVMDEFLNGGLRIGTIVEIFGESGCGKTQIALQMAAHSWDKGAVYISTEDLFPTKRLQQMFLEIVKERNHVHDISKYGEKIFILEVFEWEDFKNCINARLPTLLSLNQTIRLVVIDSIAALFRSEFQNDMKARALHLKEIGTALMNLATKFNVVFLLTNQVLSSMDSDDNVIPCLGLTWSNLLTSRIKLSKTDKYCRVPDDQQKQQSSLTNQMLQMREMRIVSSPELPSDKYLEYIITSHGVTGLNISAE